MTQHTPRIDLPTDQLAHQLNIDWESARLIKRALDSHDDLLAALRGMYYGVLRSIPVGPGLLQPELAQARAAIAKAEEGS